MEYSEEFEKRVQNQFHGFCVRVLKNESANIDREERYRYAHETSYEALPEATLLRFSSRDKYFEADRTFDVLGNAVTVEDEALAEAIKNLPKSKRDIILLAYFLEMSDADIGEMLNTIRQTVYKRRKSSLKELKKALLKEGYR